MKFMRTIFMLGLLCFVLGINTSTAALAVKPTNVADSTSIEKTLDESIQSFQSLSKKERKQRISDAKKAVKEWKAAKAAGAAGDDQVLAIIFAILIPPVGVIIKEKGQVTTKFWISLLLTLLFWLPGAIYSLLVVTGNA